MTGAATAFSVTITRTIDAPRARVFRALTEAEQIHRWFGGGMSAVVAARVDPRPGGSYRIDVRRRDGGDSTLTGVYREVVPPARLVYSWVWDDAEETLVTIELSEVASDRTALHLTHAQIPHAEYGEFHELGWAHGLGQIAALVERGANKETEEP